MTDDAARLPWTEEQWASVQRTVQEAAGKARVASSFLPLVGPLPPGQASVPALRMTQRSLVTERPQRGEADIRLEVDDGETLRLATIACEVYLTTQQAEDPDLASAKQMLGRAAEILGRLEDGIVFWGQPDRDQSPAPAHGASAVGPVVYTVQGGGPYPGLFNDAGLPTGWPLPVTKELEATDGSFSESLVREVTAAVSALEGNGHYGPFACVLGHNLYKVANSPTDSMVLPSDRIIPFLDGGPLRRSSVIGPNQGVVLALAGSPIDLVVASDMHVRFLQLSLEPRYVLRVSERLVLRIKQPGAIYRLKAEIALDDAGTKSNANADVTP